MSHCYIVLLRSTDSLNRFPSGGCRNVCKIAAAAEISAAAAAAAVGQSSSQPYCAEYLGRSITEVMRVIARACVQGRASSCARMLCVVSRRR